ncbi:MAG TPA: hypothetical protein VIQ76_11730 [Propionibacteriaceae bacterium]
MHCLIGQNGAGKSTLISAFPGSSSRRPARFGSGPHVTPARDPAVRRCDEPDRAGRPLPSHLPFTTPRCPGPRSGLPS